MHDAVVYLCGFFLGFWLASFPCFTDPIGRILDYITIDAVVIHGAADVARDRPVSYLAAAAGAAAIYYMWSNQEPKGWFG